MINGKVPFFDGYCHATVKELMQKELKNDYVTTRWVSVGR